jgi:pimeloyl-ACP methyl ester carboxylesterase
MERHLHVEIRGASLYYAITGAGPPVLPLHGSLGNSDDWGLQIGARVMGRHA